MQPQFQSTLLKRKNERSIISHIYDQRHATVSSISSALKLSRPTVMQFIKKLTEDNLILSEGLAESTGGRKALKYSFNCSQYISVGVEILIGGYEIVAIDLYGGLLKFEKRHVPYVNRPKYYDELCTHVNKFIKQFTEDEKDVLGVGISLQALFSGDGDQVVYGKILDCTGLKLKEFSTRIDVPCSMHHDAESYAAVELWFDTAIKNAIYINVRDDISGAVIINRKFLESGSLKSGLFEHMTLIPDGIPCYCGKKGCLNSYCSLSALTSQYEAVDAFFAALRKEKADCVKRWHEYLKVLALAIDNLHMIITCDVIIGGTLAKYLTQDDISLLHGFVDKRTAFPDAKNYIRASKCSNLPLAIGAAIPVVRKFLGKIMVK